MKKHKDTNQPYQKIETKPYKPFKEYVGGSDKASFSDTDSYMVRDSSGGRGIEKNDAFETIFNPGGTIMVETGKPLTESEYRKQHPVYTCVIEYFPDVLMALAHHGWKANEKHNPGTTPHWDKSKSTDEKDSLVRHLIDVAKGEIIDEDGLDAEVAIVWRACANLQRRFDKEKNV
jgi:hypothetical protein